MVMSKHYMQWFADMTEVDKMRRQLGSNLGTIQVLRNQDFDLILLKSYSIFTIDSCVKCRSSKSQNKIQLVRTLQISKARRENQASVSVYYEKMLGGKWHVFEFHSV